MDPLAQRTLNIAREALDVDDPALRAELVRRLSAGDADLEQRVAILLAEADGVEEPAVPERAARVDQFAAGDLFGAYRLLRPLGYGGMGAVWLAERADGAFQRQVALKLLRGGWLRPDDHFRRERDILARLGHPNIAQLFDGGASGDQPWFALEYVAGEQIVDWCNRRKLDVRARVRLLLPICAAVQFAHQHLVVHRDIKPANVLVAEDGTPKLLDFGIAKLIDQADGRQTQTFAMTPAYASPEQRRGETVRTPSDVYQLGLLLFELLIGYSAHELRSRQPDRVAPRIDQALTALPPAVRRETAQARGLSPERLRTTLRGDLARIVAKAMAEAEIERYESPQALAQDLENWLAGRPVRAHRGSFAYRARKFLRRNWALSAAMLVLVLVSAYYVVDLAEKSRRISEERDQALVVAGFLQDLFRGANPQETGAPNLSARELLDRGAARLKNESRLESRTRAQLQSTMARSYQGLGLYEPAQRLYSRALETFRAPEWRDPLLTARTLKDSASNALEASDATEAAQNLQEALAFIDQAKGREDMAVAYAHGAAAMSLGNLLRHADADPHYQWIARLRPQLFDQDPRFFAETSLLQVDSESANQRPDRAAEVAREAVALNREAYGEKAPDYARALVSLADSLIDIRRYDEAEKYYVAAIPRMRETLGTRHRQVGIKLNNLGLLYLRLGRFDEARSALVEALAITTDVYGPDHEFLISPLIYLSWTATELDDLEQARTWIDRASSLAGESDFKTYTGRAHHMRARIECRTRNFEAALTDFFAARAIYDLEGEPYIGPALLAHLAECLASAGREAEALSLLPDAIKGLTDGIGEQAWDTRQAILLKQRLEARH